MDQICSQFNVPSVSQLLDGFLALNAIWALCYEKAEDRASPQYRRWQWRKQVAVHCAKCYLSGEPIDFWAFRKVGFAR